LPEADVAFVDEIFKVRHRSAGNAGNAPEVAAQANSSILNSLLTLLNERAYDNGSSRCSVPLLCMIGASNELPDSEELDALYDRFMIRKCGPDVR
jgi:MoxR-like ATPase